MNPCIHLYPFLKINELKNIDLPHYTCFCLWYWQYEGLQLKTTPSGLLGVMESSSDNVKLDYELPARYWEIV